MDSWILLVEDELANRISDKNLSTKNMDDNLDPDNILDIEYKKLDSVKLINYQLTVINHFKKYVKTCMDAENTCNNMSNYMKYLYWLSDVNLYMSCKLGLQNVLHRNYGIDIIPRSSYKFCEYSHDCEFNYPSKLNKKKNTRGCYKQHFVYNYLKTDIDSVIEYLNKNNDNINYSQLNICINTILFVINKMKDELENISARYKNDYEKYHLEKSTIPQSGRIDSRPSVHSSKH